MPKRSSHVVYGAVGIAILVFFLGTKRDDLGTAVQPLAGKLRSAFTEPVPWSPGYRIPDVSRGDVLRRRDFTSGSLTPVPIRRPEDPLQGLDLSESFKNAWYKILQTSPDLPREYRRKLEELVYEDKMAGCGSWVQEYTEKHAQWLRSYNDSELTIGDKPVHPPGSRPKRLIAACFKAAGQCGGLGDRIFGHASTFLMSLLLDRVFLMHWTKDFPLLAEDTWESPYINWAWQAPPPAADKFHESVDPGDHRLGNSHNIFIQMSGEMLDQYYSTGTRDFVEETTFPGESMTVQGNKGILVRTLRNHTTWQSEKLRSLGMTEDKAWKCVLNYMVNPIPDTARLIVKYQALLRLPSVFSIGVQVRAGDWAFQEQHQEGQSWNNVLQYDYFFKCAADSALAFADPAVHKHFVIFLVTDNDNLAKHAVKDPMMFLDDGWHHPAIPNFQPMVISIGAPPIHLEKGNDDKKEGAANTLPYREKTYGMQTSILDNYIFDATDRQLLCAWSGFGLISHLRSYPWHGDTSIAMGPTGSDGGMPPLNSEGFPCNMTRAYRTLHQWADVGKGA